MRCRELINSTCNGLDKFQSMIQNLPKKKNVHKISIYTKSTKTFTVPIDQTLSECNGLPKLLLEKMKQHLDSEALIYAPTGETMLTSKLLSRSISIAQYLSQLKICSGDVVVIYSDNNIHLPAAFLGTCFYGALIASVDPNMKHSDVLLIFEDLEPKLVFTSQSQSQSIEKIKIYLDRTFQAVVLEELPDSPNKHDSTDFTPNEPHSLDAKVLIVFTSGTTGVPKAVTISHKCAMYHANRTKLTCYVDFSPLCLHYSVMLFLSSIIFGGTRLIMPSFDPKNFWKLADTYKVNFLYLNCYELKLLVEHKGCGKYFPQYMVIHGDIMTEAEKMLFQEVFNFSRLSYEYDMSELSSVFHTDGSIWNMKQLSVGLPKPGFEYKIVSFDGHKNLGFNQKGELRIKTDYGFINYYQKKSKNRIDQQGFFKTGDVAYYDKDFCFYIVDRVSNTFLSRGKRVIPGILNAIIRSHPDVEIASVVAVPDRKEHNHPVATVVRKMTSNITSRELIKFVNKDVGGHEKITALFLVEALPMTFANKVNYNILLVRQSID